MARAAAGASGVAFLSLSPADVYSSSYVGEAEAVVRRAFSLARSATPCILFFDEIDSIFGNNEDDTNEEVLNNGGNDGDLEEDLDPAKELMLQFRKYCEEAQNFAPLTNEECDAIKCLVALRKTKAPLNAYESVMEWHLGCKLGESPDYVSRKTLMKKLKERYNIEEDFHGIQEVVELPTSHTCVKVVTNDAGTAIRSLLTDPRVTDEDYLFFDDNPFSPPPDNLTLLWGSKYRAVVQSYVRPEN